MLMTLIVSKSKKFYFLSTFTSASLALSLFQNGAQAAAIGSSSNSTTTKISASTGASAKATEKNSSGGLTRYKGYSKSQKEQIIAKSKNKDNYKPFFKYNASFTGPGLNSAGDYSINSAGEKEQMNLFHTLTLGMKIVDDWSADFQTRINQNIGEMPKPNGQIEDSGSTIANFRVGIKKANIFKGEHYAFSSKVVGEIPNSTVARKNALLLGLFYNPNIDIIFPDKKWSMSHGASIRYYHYSSSATSNELQRVHLIYFPEMAYEVHPNLSLGIAFNFDARVIGTAYPQIAEELSWDTGFTDYVRVGPTLKLGEVASLSPAIQMFLDRPRMDTTNLTCDFNLSL